MERKLEKEGMGVGVTSRQTKESVEMRDEEKMKIEVKKTNKQIREDRAGEEMK